MYTSITVGIITRNRAISLKRLLLSLKAQSIRPDEVLIVDNASNDNTKVVIKSFIHDMPIRYVFEKRIGIPFARNRALKEAKGEFLAFIDDDCEASVTWVENILKAQKQYPKIVAIQGKTISLPINKLIPRIVQGLHNAWILKAKKGNKLVICDSKNLILNAKLLKKHRIKFDSDFSRGSDVDLAKQIIKKKLSIIYYPKIVNFHYERQTLISFVKQIHLQGRSHYNHIYKWSEAYFNEFKSSTYYSDLKKQVPKSFLEQQFIPLLLELHKLRFSEGWDFQKKSKVINSNIMQRIKAKNLTVAIPTKDRSTLLKECLKSLVLQSVYPKEVLVIDNGSKDNTKQIVERFNGILPIKYVLENKIGTPYARNRAIKEAKGEIIALIDDDCEAAPDWTANILKAHKLNPKAAAIQGGCELMNKSLIGLVSHRSMVSWFEGNRYSENKISILDTMNSSFKKKYIKNLIRFDSSFRNYSRGEDTDYAYQMLANNQEIIYNPLIKVFYNSRPNMLSFLSQQYRTGKSRARLNFKWSTIFNRKILPTNFQTNINPLRFYWDLLHPLLFYLRRRIYLLGYYFEMLQLLNKNLDSKVDQITIKAPKSISKLTKISVVVWMKKLSYERLDQILSQLNKQTINAKEILVLSHEKINMDYVAKRKDSLNAFKVTNVGSIYDFIVKNPDFFIGDVITLLDVNCNISGDWIEKTLYFHNLYYMVGTIHGRINFENGSFFGKYEQYIADIPFYDKDNLRTDIYQCLNVSFKKKFLQGVILKNDYIKGRNILTNLHELLICEFECYYKNSSIYISNIVCTYKQSLINPWQFLVRRYNEKASLYNLNLLRKELLIDYERDRDFLRNKSFVSSLFLVHLVNLKNPFKIAIFLILKIFELTALIFAFLVVKISHSENEIILKKFHSQRVPTVGYLNVAIVTRNRSSLLNNLLKSLCMQTIYPKRIIIIDNDSTDNTSEIIANFKKNLPIHYFKETNIGISHARNRALKIAKDGIIAFVDDDCIVQPNWIETILDAHHSHKDVAAIQGQNISIPGTDAYSFISQFHQHSYIRTISIDLEENKNYLSESYNRNLFLNGLDTKNSSFKLNTLNRLGLTFDTNLERNEDYDLAKKLNTLGEKILYIPSIKAYHRERSNLFSFLGQSFSRGINWISFAQKWDEHREIKLRVLKLEAYRSFVYHTFNNEFSKRNLGLLIVFFFMFNLASDLGLIIGVLRSALKRSYKTAFELNEKL